MESDSRDLVSEDCVVTFVVAVVVERGIDNELAVSKTGRVVALVVVDVVLDDVPVDDFGSGFGDEPGKGLSFGRGEPSHRLRLDFQEERPSFLLADKDVEEEGEAGALSFEI